MSRRSSSAGLWIVAVIILVAGGSLWYAYSLQSGGLDPTKAMSIDDVLNRLDQRGANVSVLAKSSTKCTFESHTLGPVQLTAYKDHAEALREQKNGGPWSHAWGRFLLTVFTPDSLRTLQGYLD